MGMCEYCGTSAGWFSSGHPACVAKVESAAKAVNAFVVETLLGGGMLADLILGVEKILSDNNIKEQYVHNALMDGLDAGIGQFSKRAPISNDDYSRMKVICGAYGAESPDELKRNMSLRHFGTIDMDPSNILWQAQNNCLQNWPNPVFNLQRGEILCYQVGGVTAILAEEKTVTTGRGYGGFSVPLGHGLYGHLGESRPQRVSGLMPIDAGALGITTENIYFSGSHTTVQISLRHVVRYQPYVDGIGISEAHGTPKVFTLFQDCQFPDGRSLTGSIGYDIGWFLYPLLTTLTNRVNNVSTPTSAEGQKLQLHLRFNTQLEFLKENVLKFQAAGIENRTVFAEFIAAVNVHLLWSQVWIKDARVFDHGLVDEYSATVNTTHEQVFQYLLKGEAFTDDEATAAIDFIFGYLQSRDRFCDAFFGD
jgi:hypothetical protein